PEQRLTVRPPVAPRQHPLMSQERRTSHEEQRKRRHADISHRVEALLPRSLPSVRKTSADLPQIRDEALQRAHPSVESRVESQHKHNLLDIVQTSHKTYYMWQIGLTHPAPSDPLTKPHWNETHLH